jgi:hypothetical protein
VLRLMALFLVFVLMWNTFVFRFGLLGVLCSRFKGLFILTPFSFFLTMGFRVAKVVHTLLLLLACSLPAGSALEHPSHACSPLRSVPLSCFSTLQIQTIQHTDILDLWEKDWYRGFYVVHNLGQSLAH